MTKDFGATIIGLFFGLPSTIALLLVISNIPKFTTNSAQTTANVANYTQQVTQAFVEYSLPCWFLLLGLGAVGVIAIVFLVVIFGKDILKG